MILEASSSSSPSSPPSRTASIGRVLLLLTGAAAFAATADAQAKCYNTWGEEDEKLQPCFAPGGSQAAAWCCDSQDSCLSNGLCISHESNNLLTQQGCTDPNWGGSCKRFCSASNVKQDHHRIPLVGCPASFDNKTNSIQYCCGPDPARCCENSISWISVPAGALIRPPATSTSPASTSPAPASTDDPSTDTTTSDSSVRTLGLGIGIGVGVPVFLVLLAIAVLIAVPRKTRLEGGHGRRRSRSRSCSHGEKDPGISPIIIPGRHELGSHRRHELATSVHAGANPLRHGHRRQQAQESERERDLKTAASFSQFDISAGLAVTATVPSDSGMGLFHPENGGRTWPGQQGQQTHPPSSGATTLPRSLPPSPVQFISAAPGSSATLLGLEAGGGASAENPTEVGGNKIMMMMMGKEGEDGSIPRRWEGPSGSMPAELDSGVPVGGGYGVHGLHSNVCTGQGVWDQAGNGKLGVRGGEEELNSPTLGRDVEMAMPARRD
ncbi:hypothetical protein VTJ83DRAFT_6150 [Remersonia thermophila]|uniref:Uncharacterized protein n=1 Tax=Remersonia thermophila TaxID=72144 RepID=A0ABR4D8V1_9PEZI